jgi:hypothetical protein
MMITVVALMCHTIAALPNSPVCREEIVVQDEMSMASCMMASQAGIANWKASSRVFQGDQWAVAKVRCIPGDYQPKDSI